MGWSVCPHHPLLVRVDRSCEGLEGKETPNQSRMGTSVVLKIPKPLDVFTSVGWDWGGLNFLGIHDTDEVVGYNFHTFTEPLSDIYT